MTRIHGMHTLFGARLRQWATEPQPPQAILTPGCELTYAELCRRVERCAAWLVREGCGRSDVIGITIGDELTNVIVSLALLYLGLPQTCLPTYDPQEARLPLAQKLAVTRVVVTDPRHAVPGHETSLLTPNGLEQTIDIGPCAAVNADPDATAVIFTSSGTTGEAKVIPLSQRMLASRAERRNFSPGERVLMLTTVEDYPARTSRIYCVYRGLACVLQRGSSSSPGIQELCARFAVTRLDLGVLQASGLVLDRADGDRLPSGSKVFVGGSRVPARLRQAFRTRGIALFVEYGTREAGGIADTYPVDRDEALETVGMPGPSIELEIADEHGNSLPPGETGEIRVRSADMIAEYYRDAVATARHFRNGWFYPGDLGSLTANGSLVIHGRADDMMNLNSIKIFPAEIERVLEEDPAVRAAAAFAVPSAVHGDIPVAAVELHSTATAGVEELMARARARLGVRAPRKIIVVDALPRNAAGKPSKHELINLVTRDK